MNNVNNKVLRLVIINNKEVVDQKVVEELDEVVLIHDVVEVLDPIEVVEAVEIHDTIELKVNKQAALNKALILGQTKVETTIKRFQVDVVEVEATMKVVEDEVEVIMKEIEVVVVVDVVEDLTITIDNLTMHLKDKIKKIPLGNKLRHRISKVVVQLALLIRKFRLVLKAKRSIPNKRVVEEVEVAFVLEHFEAIEIKVNVHIITNVVIKNNKVDTMIFDRIVVLMIVNPEISFHR